MLDITYTYTAEAERVFKRSVWPEHLPGVPRIGDLVQSIGCLEQLMVIDVIWRSDCVLIALGPPMPPPGRVWDAKDCVERRLAAAKGRLTKALRAVADGRCPCCRKPPAAWGIYAHDLPNHLRTAHLET